MKKCRKRKTTQRILTKINVIAPNEKKQNKNVASLIYNICNEKKMYLFCTVLQTMQSAASVSSFIGLSNSYYRKLAAEMNTVSVNF